jgi:hypothetical protein
VQYIEVLIVVANLYCCVSDFQRDRTTGYTYMHTHVCIHEHVHIDGQVDMQIHTYMRGHLSLTVMEKSRSRLPAAGDPGMSVM